ncbi:hypothetical protein [Streptosporangium sp. NPDC006007]|uniref:hypothetical protein n=1 Tax=Streptosporangium sp. NPDC006007 TaxID=3154575 RepID=UPI00339EB45C
MLSFFGVSGSDISFFGVYIVLCLALPGLLLIRALYGGSRTLAEEIALGAALGYALEVFTYIAARAIGLPLLVLAWPVGTYVLFLTVPRLRRHWRGGSHRTDKAPAWWSWSLALIVMYLVALGAVTFFRSNALVWPSLGTANIDMPYHLALIGELKNHMPPRLPMVAGESLFYHWFIYAHFAAASWVTGVEPLVLLFRLATLPMLAALVVLLGMIGRRITGSWAGALTAIAGTVFMTAPNLYLGVNIGMFTWRGFQSWTGPSLTFGAMLFAPAVLLFVDLLERRRDAGRWLLLGVFLVAVMGAKATCLLLFGGGLVAVVTVEAVTRRRPPWPALVALGMTTACFFYAQLVLFGSARQAMVIDPLSLMRRTWEGLTGSAVTVEPPLASLLGITVLYVICLAVTWGGGLGLLCKPRLLIRPPVVLLLGMGAACFAAVLLLDHPHLAQLYFFAVAYPYLMIVAAYGIVVIVRRAQISPRAMAGAVGAGMTAAYLIRMFCGVRAPLSPGQQDSILYCPYAVLVVAVLVVTVTLLVTRRGSLRAWAFVIVMFTAAGPPAAWCTRILSATDDAPKIAVGREDQPVAAQAIPRGIVEAARWLRAHSNPKDLVATNGHCRWGYESPCDSRQFWVAALSERRVLVEGWTYTSTNMSHWRPGQLPERLPFWDEERIRLNDAAFHAPLSSVIRALRERYGVRWLFADESRATFDSKIGDYAELQFRSGDYAIYRVPDSPV